jgi:hypothetical protein
MPSLTAKDRASLCLFSYEDHRRCRTPRLSTHPHFCFYHAQKESQSQAAQKLADDLAYFFSGNYLSANDLNAALGRLIPAVIRGEIKPRLARTVAYMLQTLMQSTRQAQHEFIEAHSTDHWRRSIRHSLQTNHDHLYPKDPVPDAEAQPPAEAESPAGPVGAGLARPATPTPPPQPPSSTRPSPTDTQAALNIARNLFPERPTTNTAPTQLEPPTTPTVPPTNPTTQTTQPKEAPPSPTQPPTTPRQPGAPIRAPYTYHYGPEYRLYVDGKPFTKQT